MYVKRVRASLGLCGLLAAGCQSYEPRPLNLDEHRRVWLDRSPSSEPVTAFARRLETHGDEVTSFDPADGVSLREAELIALVFNAELRLARARAGVAAATAEHAGLWEDPELQVDVLRITESVASPLVVKPGLAFTIPISGRLGVERTRADAALRVELERVAEAEWRVRHELRGVWLSWSAVRTRVEEAERLIASMDGLVGSTGRLAEAGELLRTEAALFAIEQARRRYELLALRGEAAEGEQRLRDLMGLSPYAPLALEPALDARGSIEPGHVDAMTERNPTLARLREEYEVAERTLEREIRKQYPDLTLGPVYETDQGQSRIGFLGAIPLPVLNANRQGIAEANAARELARAAFETEYERLAGELASARARAETHRARLEMIVAELAPLVDRQLDDARRLIELGEGGAAGLVLLESLVRAYATKLALIDARLRDALATAEIEFLVGPEEMTR